jgi:predicted extracellular nuclease
VDTGHLRNLCAPGEPKPPYLNAHRASKTPTDSAEPQRTSPNTGPAGPPVELFNRGSGAVAVDGWTLQYASAAGTTWQATALSGAIPAGGRYFVQLAAGGANGVVLPVPDGGTANLAVTGGKVALVDDATSLSCGASAGPAFGSDP